MTQKTYSINDVKAVILVGGRDFGRCPIATRRNRALWPIAGKPALQRLIEHIAGQGVRRFVLCCEHHAGAIRRELDLPDYLEVQYIEQAMPRGTAGSILDAAEPGRDELLFVFTACTVTLPDIHEIISAHRDGGAEMTAFFNPAPGGNGRTPSDAQLYVCESGTLSHIPQKGYCDIKEGLVPALVSADKPVYAAQLATPSRNFTNWRQYLSVSATALETMGTDPVLSSGFEPVGTAADVWVGGNVQIADSARLCGPVLIESGSQIGANAVILGPTLIGQNVMIGCNTVVQNSVIWDNATIGRGCQIRRSLVDQQRKIPTGAELDGVPAAQPRGFLDGLFEGISMRMKRSTQPPTVTQQTAHTLGDCLRQPRLKWMLFGLTAVMLGALMVTYWQSTVLDLWRVWLRSDEYSSGLLVPFLAAYVLWVRRQSLLDSPVKPAVAGIIVLLAAQAFRLFGLYFMFNSAERIALVMSVGGIVLLLYGWTFFRRFLPVFLFLFLMLPLPRRVETMITLPLQQFATVSAVFSLETIGYSVIREGNVIRIGETVVAVAEACNGLRMLTAFFVISGFVVLISTRKFWEKAVILVSTIPIALLCNTIRLTLTSIAFTYVHTETLEELFHDFGGLAMMPLAIGLILLELWLMKVLFTPPETIEHQVVISRSSS